MAIFDGRNAKYDGKEKDFSAWSKSARELTRKGSHGDLKMDTYYETAKPEDDIKYIAKATKSSNPKYEKKKYVEKVKTARDNFRNWIENAEKEKLRD